jgi:phosphoribosyl 1,2-cyclic phosphodiesterase
MKSDSLKPVLGDADDMSISDMLAARGYTHHKSDAGLYKHAIYDRDGKLVGHMNAGEAVEFMERLDAEEAAA